MVYTLVIMFQNPDDTLQTVAFETIGEIVVCLEGQLLLAELSNEFIEETGEVIRDRATEITAMNAPASQDEENQTEQMSTISCASKYLLDKSK